MEGYRGGSGDEALWDVTLGCAWALCNYGMSGCGRGSNIIMGYFSSVGERIFRCPLWSDTKAVDPLGLFFDRKEGYVPGATSLCRLVWWCELLDPPSLQGLRAALGGWLLWDVSIESGRLIITGCVWEEAECPLL